MAIHRWTRLSSQKWEDVWSERLQYLGPERVAMFSWPHSRALKLEVYADKKVVDALVKRFGGKSTPVAKSALAGVVPILRSPLAIRGRLRVFSDEGQWAARTPRQGDLRIPAGMAFGTGDHATTATCLRLLCDLAPSLPPVWHALDAGTGSGILAIAAEKLGARSVLAFDFDPVCVRIAKENRAANACVRTTIKKADVRNLVAFPVVDVITANLFSDLLVEVAPALASHLLPQGWFLFSGVLRHQYDTVAHALFAAGFAHPRVIMRGKWCAGITQKLPSPAKTI